MTRPVAAVAPRPLGTDVVGAAAGLRLLLVLPALLVWPLAGVFIVGLLTPPAPLAGIVDTLAVAAVATLGALVMAAILTAAVRFGAPGGGAFVAICRAGVLVPPFVVPLGVLVLAGPDRLGLPATAGSQALAFLPHAFVLGTGALAGVSAEAEQAAELRGASRWTVLRRVTLGMASPGLLTAALVVLGLCLADVASPLLVGGRVAGNLVLAGFIVAAAHWTAPAAAAAVALSTL